MENTTRMSIEFSADALSVLELLPREPQACPISDIAQDLFDKADSKARCRIKRALMELRGLLYIDICNTRKYGNKDWYGIKAKRWEEAKAIMGGKKIPPCPWLDKFTNGDINHIPKCGKESLFCVTCPVYKAKKEAKKKRSVSGK